MSLSAAFCTTLRKVSWEEEPQEGGRGIIEGLDKSYKWSRRPSSDWKQYAHRGLSTPKSKRKFWFLVDRVPERLYVSEPNEWPSHFEPQTPRTLSSSCARNPPPGAAEVSPLSMNNLLDDSTFIYEENEDPRCSGCLQYIEDGSVIQFGEGVWHFEW